MQTFENKISQDNKINNERMEKYCLLKSDPFEYIVSKHANSLGLLGNSSTSFPLRWYSFFFDFLYSSLVVSLPAFFTNNNGINHKMGSPPPSFRPLHFYQIQTLSSNRPHGPIFLGWALLQHTSDILRKKSSSLCNRKRIYSNQK